MFTRINEIKHLDHEAVAVSHSAFQDFEQALGGANLSTASRREGPLIAESLSRQRNNFKREDRHRFNYLWYKIAMLPACLAAQGSQHFRATFDLVAAPPIET